MTATAPMLYDVIDGTWPAAHTRLQAPWLLREGQNGGQRVSATTAAGCTSDADIDAAEAAMQAMHQPRLFQIRQDDQALDQLLEHRGYRIVDPVNMWLAPVAVIASETPPPVTAFAIWPPLAIQNEIWIKSGIAEGRLAVMHRAQGEKAAILGRIDDSPAGTGFVAIHQNIAMLHALEVLPKFRRKGLARWMIRQAAFWATQNGATEFAVICTAANTAANGLYSALGMSLTGHYHYRRHQDDIS